MVSQIRSILFLSTPHRGSALAQSANRLLALSPIGSAKKYMAEISQHSLALEEMNDQFRNAASNLQIFCFYETLYSGKGPVRLVSSSIPASRHCAL